MQTLDSPEYRPRGHCACARRSHSNSNAIRIVRIGLLGLGQVGQAVARLAADRSATAHAGLRFQVEQVLVREIDKPRNCPKPGRLTEQPRSVSAR